MNAESGQDEPALEDQQPPADHGGVSATEVDSEQVSDVSQDEGFEGALPVEDRPVEDRPVEDRPVEDRPVEDRPVEDRPVDGAPVEDHSVEGRPVDGAPAEDAAVASALEIEGLPEPDPLIVRVVEALLFLAPDPLSPRELADATAVEELAVIAALTALAERYGPGHSGIHLRELGGGFTFASDPLAEDAARRLFSRPRASALTPAQAETLAIVAYLQPVSRPEITRIRGVSADSAASTLLERGLVEESGRSQFGAVLYRTSTQFLKLFGLKSLDELPDVAQWDPTPEEQAELRDRLLRAGEARSGDGP